MLKGNLFRACLLLVYGSAAMASGSEASVFPVRMGSQAVDRLKERHAHLMTLSEEELVALVPVQSGI